MKWLSLCATLALALALRLPGIGWGLPPTIQQVRASDFWSSYAFDEDDILSGAAKASVARLDFDPHEYHWGTLHIELVLLTLDGAQALGVFGVPWRTAYYNLVEGDFDRVYVVGRLVAVVEALLTILFLWLIPNGGDVSKRSAGPCKTETKQEIVSLAHIKIRALAATSYCRSISSIRPYRRTCSSSLAMRV